MRSSAIGARHERAAFSIALIATLVIVFGPLLLHAQLPSIDGINTGRAWVAVAVFVAWLVPSAWRLIAAHRATASESHSATDPSSNPRSVLIVHASQTGSAEQYAQQTADSLRAVGWTPQLLDIARLSMPQLLSAQRILFVASTTGEGDAPDAALGFITRAMSQMPALATVRYGVLALGDREYTNFCAFGHRLDAWLRACGAEPWFDLVEVDNGDAGALRHWQHHLGVLSEHTELPDWSSPRYEHWRLISRTCANEGSQGAAAFHLRLQSPAGAPGSWRAGDVAEIGPCHADADVAAFVFARGLEGAASVQVDGVPISLTRALSPRVLPGVDQDRDRSAQDLIDTLPLLPHREYSIASIAADGHIDLLVRQMARADGSPGIGSGWLCQFAPIGADIALRVRRNSSFHAPDDARPLILIGNGTGIAGLRALLRERIAAGRHRNWLLFGERSRAQDYFWSEEIETWFHSGQLQHLDVAFSRDQAERRYVQHAMAEQAIRLRQWIAEGASVYVCGNLRGMAPAVDAVLRNVLGDQQVQQLAAEGRYRRDVY